MTNKSIKISLIFLALTSIAITAFWYNPKQNTPQLPNIPYKSTQPVKKPIRKPVKIDSKKLEEIQKKMKAGKKVRPFGPIYY